MSDQSRAFFHYILTHLAVGLVISGLVAVGLIAFDVGGIGGLIMRSEQPFLYKVILFFSLSITICSATIGTAIMALGRPDQQD